MYLFDADQNLPSTHTIEKICEKLYADEPLTAVIYCFLGNPNRNQLAFTGGGSIFTDEASYTDGTAANQDTATITVPTTFSGFGSPLAMRVGVAEGDQVEDAFDTLNIAPVKAGANG